jgi:hypothetical protein
MDKSKPTPTQEEHPSKKISLDVSNILVDEKKATMTVTLSWIDKTPPDNIEMTGMLFTMMYQMQNVFQGNSDKTMNTVEKKFYDLLKSTIKYIVDERKERQNIIDSTMNIFSKNGKNVKNADLNTILSVSSNEVKLPKRVRTKEAIDKANATRKLNQLKKLNTKETQA